MGAASEIQNPKSAIQNGFLGHAREERHIGRLRARAEDRQGGEAMNWLQAPIGTVAPAQTSSKRLPPDSEVWQLSLDQIESDTGRIVGKETGLADEAGSSTYVFDSGNVLYSKLRPYLNKVVCPNEVGIATTELVPLRPREKLLDRRYLTYYLRSPGFVSFATVTVAGVKMPRIIMNKFWEHQIPLPTLTEQRRIVEILDQADVLRQQRRAADEKAQRILPALFYRMFGDPATNPMGWPAKPIGEMVDPILRRDPSIQPHKPFLYIDIAGVNGSLGIIANANEVMGAEAPSRARQIVRKNDVIISTVRPYLRATALVPSECDNQICSTGFCVLRAKNQQGFGFLYALSRLQWFTDQLNARARGASYPAVTDADILNLRVPQPTGVEAIESFDRQVLDVLMLQEKRSSVGDCIESQCEVLLHRAFSGELTAKWREAHREELEAEIQAQGKALAKYTHCPFGRNRQRRPFL